MDKKDFIDIFQAESDDHLDKMEKLLVLFEKEPANIEIVKELNREAHTLKGMARVMGYNEIQEIAHRVEEIFDNVTKKKMTFDSFLAEKIFRAIDVIRVVLKTVVKDENPNVDITEICRDLEQGLNLKDSMAPGLTDKSSVLSGTEVVQPAGAKQEAAASEYVRISVNKVNKLLNLGGELVGNKMKASEKISRVKRLSKLGRDLLKKMNTLDDKIKKAFLMEDVEIADLFSSCFSDIQRIKEESSDVFDIMTRETFDLDPVVDDLQNRLKELRMLPCATIFQGFPRMIRDIAVEEHKEVSLEIVGEETELDRKVLEGIKTPLMHILRNCVDHGIEAPDERVSLGKTREGMIRMSAFHEGGDVIIKIEDDGRGIDVEEIKRTALKKQLISVKEFEKMTEKEALNIIFMNGYSTSPIITDVSGRGIGLDVARRDIENLKGMVVLETEKGKGTVFTLVLPLTIAVIQVLLVKSQGMRFAFPMVAVEEILNVQTKDISTLDGKMAVQARGRTVPLVELEEVLGLPPLPPEENDAPRNNAEIFVVMVTSLDKWVGFVVDEIAGEEEIFIKNLGAYLGKIPNVSGAAILGNAEAVVILDTADLVKNSRQSHPAVSGRKVRVGQENVQKSVLVADDTLTTRELEKSILETRGYRVDIAVDGLDALDKIAKSRYDLLVTDVEMPRMNGFELCRSLKQSEAYKHIPVVIVTAMEKEEDKKRGIEAGAQAYILKSVFDQGNLLDAIERLIGV